MSDGSSIVDSDIKDMEHMDAAFHHMKTLMASVGALRVSIFVLFSVRYFVTQNLPSGGFE